MTEAMESYDKHRLLAITLLGTGLSTFLIGAILLITPLSWFTWIFAIVALVTGRAAFRHFEEADKVRPIDRVWYNTNAYTANLKNREEVVVTIEYQYKTLSTRIVPSRTINSQIQRSLNEYFTTVEKLSENPFVEVDTLLARTLEPMISRLNLRDFLFQTIDVKSTGDPPSSSQGIYFGER